MVAPQVPRRSRSTTAVVAVVAAAAVVVAAGVAGYLALGGRGGDKNDTTAPITATRNPSVAEKTDPTLRGWMTVTNPKDGITFDVPPEWAVKSTSWVSYVTDEKDPDDKPLIGFSAPAMLKEKWCQSDDGLNGAKEDTALASVGTRGEHGTRHIEEAARNTVYLWVYGAYTQPDRAKIQAGPVESYTTMSGLRGTVATAASSGVPKKGKCDTDGKATTFAFENADGDIVSWTFLGARGVKEEVPDETVRKILGTVRLYDNSSSS
ncbi:hypothetical protein SHXM_01866 [Streptomyces hygroscopicus]|nr:hypothetical protein [Streptomyces hygroscopicus]AQW48403.1 hypothetical protein SHXM_01866 [Streptomyces hygroscopicus]